MHRSLLAVALGVPLCLPVAATASERLFVSGRDALVAYDLATGQELARFATPGLSADMVVLETGHVLLNHRDGNAVLIVDARRLEEVARLPSSGLGGTRPVHAYLSPTYDGRRFFVALNDGVEANTPPGQPAQDSSALFIDASPESPTFLRPVGEVRLGTGHHKMNFAPDRPRAAISNIGDCQAVLQVIDFADPAGIRIVATLDAAGIGLDGREGRPACHPRGGEAGVRPAPHGAATDPATGRGYHNLTGLGAFVSLDMRADAPAFRVLPPTRGWGGAAIVPHPTAGLLYGPQYAPREGDARAPGAACQVGQLAVLDARADRVAAEVPVLKDGPDCTRSLAGTPEAGARPGYGVMAGNALFLPLGTLGPATARSHAVAVMDLSIPETPRQLPSIRVGAHHGHRDAALTADGRLLVVPSNLDNAVQVIDTASREVVRSLPVVEMPGRVAVFGAAGPSRAARPVAVGGR
jgi:hypothetical protein